MVITGSPSAPQERRWWPLVPTSWQRSHRLAPRTAALLRWAHDRRGGWARPGRRAPTGARCARSRVGRRRLVARRLGEGRCHRPAQVQADDRRGPRLDGLAEAGPADARRHRHQPARHSGPARRPRHAWPPDAGRPVGGPLRGLDQRGGSRRPRGWRHVAVAQRRGRSRLVGAAGGCPARPRAGRPRRGRPRGLPVLRRRPRARRRHQPRLRRTDGDRRAGGARDAGRRAGLRGRRDRRARPGCLRRPGARLRDVRSVRRRCAPSWTRASRSTRRPPSSSSAWP